jgi:hypothetical protein
MVGSDIRRSSPAVAYVAPLAVFLILSMLIPAVQVENEMLPWWRHAPEHWVYPLQALVCGGLLWYFRGHFTLRPWRGLGWAVVLGTVGILWWCVPAWGYRHLNDAGLTPPGWMEWFGLAPREEGFDPELFGASGPGYTLVLALRFFRMVVIVPLVEEIFWRGFLMRYLQADGGPFQKVPFGRHDWRTYLVVTGLFMVAHASVDWTGALGFGSLMYWLTVRQKSLGACVLMHAVANLLLGVYVVWTRQWGFW